MKPSVTLTGLVLAVALPLVGAAGFSETCSNEIVQFGLSLPGVLIALYGRVRQGDINAWGLKK